MKRIALIVLTLAFFALPITGSVAQEDDRFDFIIKSASTPNGHVGTAEYQRVLPSGAVWYDGDRVGYRVVYGFLDCNLANATLNLRVAAHGYNNTGVVTQILDRYMDEGSRRWDGTIEPDGDIPARDSDAPKPASHGAGFPTSVPVIEVHLGDEVCEVRDYNNVVRPGVDVTWAVVKDTPTEVIVGWFVDGKAAVEFYYTIIGGSYQLRIAN